MTTVAKREEVMHLTGGQPAGDSALTVRAPSTSKAEQDFADRPVR